MDSASYTKETGFEVSREDLLSEVRVFLEVETVQPDETQGLAFAIEIINESNEPITLSDPTEAVVITLFDDKSGNCGLPVLVADMHAYYTGERDPLKKRAWLAAQRARMDAQRSYAIDKPEAGTYPSTTKTIHEVDAESRRVTLQPGERFWMPLRVSEVRADPITKEERVSRGREASELAQQGIVQTDPVPPPKRAPIAAEMYDLYVCAIVTSWVPNDSGYVGKTLRKTVGVPIRLGEPAAE